MKRSVTLIAGPTASGKTRMAIELARQSGGVIINADSMQVYDVLDILTARPDTVERKAAPHHLFGHVDPAQDYSTGKWLDDVSATLAIVPPDQPIVFCGGTGLYFRALTEGLSDMPVIAEDQRAHWRNRLQQEGAVAMHELLQAQDPETARTLNPSDGHRIIRALETLTASGQSIRWWHARKSAPIISENATKIVLEPNREALHRRINDRFAAMIDRGAIREVENLRAMGLPPDKTVMKAIGVREISDFLDGIISRDEMIARGQAATRQYAKRQMTWHRNQMDHNWRRVAV